MTEETGALTQAIATGRDNRRCAERIAALERAYRRKHTRFTDAEREDFRNRLDIIRAAVDVRAKFRNAAVSGTPRVLTATAQALSNPVETDKRTTLIHQAALAMLAANERAEIARAALDADRVLAAHQARERAIVNGMRGLDSTAKRRTELGELDKVARDLKRKDNLHAASPSHGDLIDEAVHVVTLRRDTLERAMRRARAIVKKRTKGESEDLAQLNSAEAAELYGTDPALMAHDESALAEILEAKLPSYARAMDRACQRVEAEHDDPDDIGYHTARLCTRAQLRALEAQEAPAADTIAAARRREARAKRLTVLRIRELVTSLEIEDDTPQAQRAGLAGRPRRERIRLLQAVVSHPRTVERLTRDEARRAARRAGLFGAPRAPQPEMAPTRSEPEAEI